MPDNSDAELLQDFCRLGSEPAFADLVDRHINLVYSTALRHVGNTAHAEEITQAVFTIFARKAASLRPDTVLEAWLYETTRLTSLSFLRGERRRQLREQEAYMQSILQESTDASTWNQLSPLLDEAIARLGKKDREAVMLRFFKEKNLREVATAMNITEAAAQSRVHRALDKLHRYFSRRGVNSTTVIIAGEISTHSIQIAPIGLAKSVSAIAISKSAMASTSTLTLVKGALKIMAWSKAKTAVVIGVTRWNFPATFRQDARRFWNTCIKPRFCAVFESDVEYRIVPPSRPRVFSTKNFGICHNVRFPTFQSQITATVGGGSQRQTGNHAASGEQIWRGLAPVSRFQSGLLNVMAQSKIQGALVAVGSGAVSGHVPSISQKSFAKILPHLTCALRPPTRADSVAIE